MRHILCSYFSINEFTIEVFHYITGLVVLKFFILFFSLFLHRICQFFSFFLIFFQGPRDPYRVLGQLFSSFLLLILFFSFPSHSDWPALLLLRIEMAGGL